MAQSTIGRQTRPAPPSYQEAFLEILGNRAKGEGEGPVRERGFVVFARDAATLQPLQATCFEQRWNRVLTARYRLTGGLAFGTILSALATDIRDVRTATSSPSSFIGDLLPEVPTGGSDTPWQPLVRSVALDGLYAREDTNEILEGGDVNRGWVQAFFEALGDEGTLKVGDRLVVFCGLADEPDKDDGFDEHDDWGHAFLALATIPERVGIVFSNPPASLALPDDDPHFLDLSLRSLARPASPLPLRRRGPQRRPGSRAGSARRIPVCRRPRETCLLPETRPLTIGVHAPWGGGKSSFMNFIQHALVTNLTGSNWATHPGSAISRPRRIERPARAGNGPSRSASRP